MISFLLQISARYIMVFQIILSLFFLFRGHNHPGGGFIGGLLIASAFILYAFAFDVDRTKDLLRIRPEVLIGSGLATALISGLISVMTKEPFLTARWVGSLSVPGIGKLGLGTPFLFDIGVYMVVFGVAISVVFEMLTQNDEDESDEWQV